jgi:hypothetical protein
LPCRLSSGSPCHNRSSASARTEACLHQDHTFHCRPRQATSILHEQFAVPLDFVRGFLLNGLRRLSRATLLPPGRVRPKLSRCSTSCTACDLPVHQLGRGLSSSNGDTTMRCTPSSCTAISPPTVAGPAFASALPNRFRARPNRVRS